MTVTRIEELSRSRCKIYLEDSFAFVLYKGELRLYGVREQEELSEESYREIPCRRCCPNGRRCAV